MSGPELVLAIFFVNLIFVIALYLFAGRLKVPTSKEPSGKFTPYASGEDLPPMKVQFYPQNFFYAVYFTIFDVAAFIIATSAFQTYARAQTMLPLLYIAIILLALFILPRR